MMKISPEWVTAISTCILMLATIALVTVGYKAAETWKQEKRYDAFNSYQEKLQMKEDAAWEVMAVINTFKNFQEKDKNNPEYFYLFKNKLKQEHRKYIALSRKANNDIFKLFSNTSTNEAVNKMFKIDVEFNNLLIPIQTLNKSKEINYKEIDNKFDGLLKAIDKVISESANSIKTKDTIKL